MTGAEENWGLIGFSSSMVLFDPEKTSDNLKQDVCETVTHELAHQVGQKANDWRKKKLSKKQKNKKQESMKSTEHIKTSQGYILT